MLQYFDQQYEIAALDTDLRGRLRHAAVMRYMQEAADDHLAQHGRPRSVLVQSGTVFVLTRAAVRLSAALEYKERVTVRTWHRNNRGPLFFRHYLFMHGERVFGGALTQWVLFDLNEQRIVRPSPEDGLYSRLMLDRDCGVDFLPRVPQSTVLAPLCTRRVQKSDIDINGHVNNSRYADIVYDALPCESVSVMDITYLHQCFAGDELTLSGGPLEDGYALAGDTGGKTAFTARVTMEEVC